MNRIGRRSRTALLAWAALTLLSVAAARAAPALAPAPAPAPGRYDGELCVALKPGPLSCGRVQVELASGGLATARVDDIVYHLQVRAGREVAVLLTQGAGQLDAFVADGGWDGTRLRFADGDRNARYEVRIGPRASR